MLFINATSLFFATTLLNQVSAEGCYGTAHFAPKTSRSLKSPPLVLKTGLKSSSHDSYKPVPSPKNFWPEKQLFIDLFNVVKTHSKNFDTPVLNCGNEEGFTNVLDTEEITIRFRSFGRDQEMKGFRRLLMRFPEWAVDNQIGKDNVMPTERFFNMVIGFAEELVASNTNVVTREQVEEVKEKAPAEFSKPSPLFVEGSVKVAEKPGADGVYDAELTDDVDVPAEFYWVY